MERFGRGNHGRLIYLGLILRCRLHNVYSNGLVRGVQKAVHAHEVILCMWASFQCFAFSPVCAMEGGGRGRTSRRFSALRVVNMNSLLNVFSLVVGCYTFWVALPFVICHTLLVLSLP